VPRALRLISLLTAVAITCASAPAPLLARTVASPSLSTLVVAAGSAPAVAPDANAARKRKNLRANVEQGAQSMSEVGRELGDRILTHVPGVLLGVLLFAFFWTFARVAGRLLRRLFARTGADPALAHLAVPLARISLLVLGALAAFEQMGFNVGSLLAGVGVAGLAIGLAAQETIANVLGGIILLWDRPFRLGDSITVDDTFGTVTEIGFRSTRLRTLEQREVTLPNKDVAQKRIVNHSRYPEVRINAPFQVGYRENLGHVRALVLAAVASEGVVLPEPPPQVVVTALADSGVSLELRAWAKTPVPESATLFHLLELVKRTLDEAGVEIPFPQRTLHLPTLQFENLGSND
jgi:small conductance mechanosensitive channel